MGGARGIGVKGLKADRLVGFSSFVQANTDQRVRLLWDDQQLQNLQWTWRLEVYILLRTDRCKELLLGPILAVCAITLVIV